MAFGPDGALYVLDYGTGWFNGDANSALYRIEYIGGGNRAPIARGQRQPDLRRRAADRAPSPRPAAPTRRAARSPTRGTSATAPPRRRPTRRRPTPPTAPTPPTLTVTRPAGRDRHGQRGDHRRQHRARRSTINAPADGQLFTFGDTVPFTITVTDPEDGTIDCARVKMTYVARPRQPRPPDHLADRLLRHDHRSRSTASTTPRRTSSASSTPSTPTTAGSTTHTQQHRCSRSTGRPSTSARQSGRPARRPSRRPRAATTVGDIDNGDWISFTPYTLSNATAFTARVSSAGAGGTLEVRAGSADRHRARHGRPCRSPAAGRPSPTSPARSPARRPAPPRCTWSSPAAPGALFDVDAFTFTTGGRHRRRADRRAGRQVPGRRAAAATADGTQIQIYDLQRQRGRRPGRSRRSDAAGRSASAWTSPAAAPADGTKIQLWTCNGDRRAELDRAAPTAPLRNPQSGKCLDVSGNSSADGTAVTCGPATAAPTRSGPCPD